MTGVVVPSAYQAAIYTWIAEGSGSAIVEAVAGSGKTTTILEGLRRKAPSASARLFAFNTAIAKTLEAHVRSIPKTIASTFHAAGYRAVARHLGLKQLAPDGRKIRHLLYDVAGPDDAKRLGDFVVKLVALAKGEGIGAVGPDTPAAWQGLVDHHGLVLETGPDDVSKYLALEQRAITLAQRLFQVSVEAAETEFAIDFDDLLYLPLRWDLDLDRYDWVGVDEAQDTNPVRRRIAEKSLAPGGRLLAVGDRAQAIYGFTGASVDALDQIHATFQTTALPLSICYRCAQAVVREAQRLVPQMEHAPGAVMGSVETVTDRALRRLGPADAILCRTNAPLVTVAYDLIRAGVGCRILGREIGQGLVALVEKLKAPSLRDLPDRLAEWLDRETAKLTPKRETRGIAAAQDKVDCLLTVLEQLRGADRTIAGLKTALERLFGDEPRGVLTLSTMHKAKGQEWPTVAVIRPDLLPAPWARQDWEIQQEINLQYVAITRAKERLWWVVPEEDPA